MNQNNLGISLNEFFEVSLPGFATAAKDLSLVICCKKDTFEFQHASVANNSPDSKWLFPDLGKESIHIFPLYVHHENMINHLDKINTAGTSNLNPNMVDQFAKKLGLPFKHDPEDAEQENNSPVCYANSEEISEEFKIEKFPQSFYPIDLLDYIYAVLYSPKYKEKYQDELKKDFPIVPFPRNQINFWKLKTLGAALRKLHLIEGPEVEKFITQFPIEGKNIVTKIRFEENYEIINGNTIIHLTPLYAMGRVYINETQFFQMVPKLAWEFTLGIHQPARQWLENKKKSVLSKEEIIHYQKIIVVLFETDSIQNEIDNILF